MRFPRTSMFAVAAALPLVLAGCGSSSSSSSTAGGTVCAPVAGSALVLLKDDKKLQSSDNIVPLVRTAILTTPLSTALDKVSAALSQTALTDLNKSTDIDRMEPARAATDFVKAQSLTSGLSGGSGPIRVVAANFSENQTLANIYVDVLKAAGFDATVVPLMNREAYISAFGAGQVDVVPDYAATLTEFLNVKANGPDATKTSPKASGNIDTTITALKALATPLGLTPLTPAAATDENAFAVTKAFADKYKVTSLTGLSTTCNGGLTLGGPTECAGRSFCELGLKDTYGIKVTSLTTLDAGGPLSKNALKTGKVALALVLSSDASLSAA